MSKLKIQLIDASFFDSCGPSYGTGSLDKAPKNTEYVHFDATKQFKFTFFTDFCLYQVDSVDNTQYKIALIMEPKELHPFVYQDVIQNQDKFDYILTHDIDLLNINPNKFKFIPANGHWIHDQDIKIHDKTKNISIFASNKNDLVGHKLRHDIVSIYNQKIDGIFGRNSYQYLENKIDGLRDYRYHIVIENNRKDYYFTEKLVDCFITGCIPIYYGCPSINKFFDIRGIFQFSNIEEFEKHISYNLEESYSILKQNGVLQENFNRAQQYLYPEDYIYNTLLKDLK